MTEGSLNEDWIQEGEKILGDANALNPKKGIILSRNGEYVDVNPMKIEALSGFSESTMHHCWPMQPAGKKVTGFSVPPDG